MVDELLTLREAARLLKVHERTVRRWITSGQLSAMRIGRTVRIRRDTVYGLAGPAGAPALPPDLPLPESGNRALSEIRAGLNRAYPDAELIVYGSSVRGTADEESDIDLLVVTAEALERSQKNAITDLVFDANMKHDANVSALVVDRRSWQTGPISVMPIRDEIAREGITL